jgi:formiminotetrahydrofolate cyclodeaminase
MIGGNMLVDMTMRNFVEMLGSNSPTPGGGSVAALSGAAATFLQPIIYEFATSRRPRQTSRMTAQRRES